MCGTAEWYRTADKEGIQELEDHHSEHQGWRMKTGRKKEGKRYVESVLFVPYTPDGVLKTRVNALEGKMRFTTRYKVV